jgi:hypothetical protein
LIGLRPADSPSACREPLCSACPRSVASTLQHVAQMLHPGRFRSPESPLGTEQISCKIKEIKALAGIRNGGTSLALTNASGSSVAVPCNALDKFAHLRSLGKPMQPCRKAVRKLRLGNCRGESEPPVWRALCGQWLKAIRPCISAHSALQYGYPGLEARVIR